MSDTLKSSSAALILTCLWGLWLLLFLMAVSNVIPNLLGVLICAVAWLILTRFTIVSQRLVVILIATTTTAIGAHALGNDWDLAIRISYSEPMLSSYVQEHGALTAKRRPPVVRLFAIKSVKERNGITYLTTHHFVMNAYGLAHVPDGIAPPKYSRKIHKNWFTFRQSLSF